MRANAAVAQRNAAVLIWVPVLLAKPVLDRPAGAAAGLSVALVLVAATSCVIAVIDSWPAPTTRSTLAGVVLAAAVTAGSVAWPGWSSAWLLVAMTLGAALPPAWALAAVPLSAAVAAATWTRFEPTDGVLSQAFVVLLAGTTAGVLHRLVATSEALRRTRDQLAVVAVARERERVARDLHDVLGHTLSVMVVKAAAVRRLIHADPEAAAVHAADIEDIGRAALTQVRQTIHAASDPTLEDEIAGAREAFAAAGIEVTMPDLDHLPSDAEGPLAWALREGVTNVLRHSAASSCRVSLTHDDGALRLVLADDGIGHVAPRADQLGGLDGLRRRLSAAGGGLDVAPGADGFVLTAWVPDSSARS